MKKIILSIFGVLALVGCNGYFDVSPRTEVRAEDVFKTEDGFWDALTGLYIGMTDQGVYGKNLSWDAIEFMAWEHINRLQTGSWFYLQRADYTDQSSKQFGEMAWNKLYNVIAEANYLLYAVDEYGGYLSEDVRRTVRGEALAIRAYCHFDLLRLYAPVASAENMNKLVVPYVLRYDKHSPAQISYSETLKLLRADIDEAARLLDERTLPESRRLYRSNTNMNWAAVQLLKARVGQWSRDPNTLQYALTLIEYFNTGSSKWAVDQDSFTPMMSTEVLFGVNVWDLKKFTEFRWDEYVGASANDDMLISPNWGSIDNLFVNPPAPFCTSQSDIRYIAWFEYFVNYNTWKEGHLSVKIRNKAGTNANSLAPLMRMSEAWLIAADAAAATDMPLAVRLINELRDKRNVSAAYYVPDDVSEADMHSVIEYESRREFAQEGQLFFMFKRLGTKRIPGMLTAVADMTPEKYIIPYPEAISEFGIKQ